MLRRKIVIGFLLLLTWPGSAQLQQYGLGTPLKYSEIVGWDIDVRPDGTGLPPGKGSVGQGKPLYAEHCSACHGDNGNDGPAGFSRLVGGQGTLGTPQPVRTVGSYWPYATTIYDYVRRAMPLPKPQSLTSDEVYAVVAYLLHLNGIIPQDTTLDARSLPLIKMPNVSGFVTDPRPDIVGDPCVSDCR